MDTPLATADASFIGHESAAPMAEQSGHAGCLGDADGDGFADIVIGAPGHGDGDGSTGRAYM
ncbi:MAG: FG-GAP repeat protein, partial [Myxococcota bacterium]|nr:FG-GAP repeat protein [Myxococcota bacterium]